MSFEDYKKAKDLMNDLDRKHKEVFDKYYNLKKTTIVKVPFTVKEVEDLIKKLMLFGNTFEKIINKLAESIEIKQKENQQALEGCPKCSGKLINGVCMIDGAPK